MLAIAIQRQRPPESTRARLAPASKQGSAFAGGSLVSEHFGARASRKLGCSVRGPVIEDNDSRKLNAHGSYDRRNRRLFVQAWDHCGTFCLPVHCPKPILNRSREK